MIRKSTSPGKVCALSFIAAFGTAAGVAARGETTADQTTEESREVIVVGQRERPITIAARGLSVSLGEEQFDAINALNVEDLMKYAPNFYVRKRYIGDANAVVGLRGTNTLQSARTLVLVDGFVVSNFLGNRYDYPPKWNVVGPGEVRQFDIVYGPYSARYNGYSMGGIVSVTTREPEGTEFFATSQGFTMPYKQYGTDATYSGYTMEGGGGWKQSDGPWSARASVRRQANYGQPMTFNLLTPTTGAATAVTGAFVDPGLATPVFAAVSPDHTVQDQFRSRVGFDFGNGWKADGLFFYWQTDSDQTDPQSYLRDATGLPVYQGKVQFNGATYNATGMKLSIGDRLEMLAGARLGGPLAGGKFSTNLSHYWIERQRTWTSNDYNTGIADGAGTFANQHDTGWWTLDSTFERQFGRHGFAAGANANLYETGQDSFKSSRWRESSTPSISATTAGKTSVIGAFVEDVIDIGARLSVTPGVRVDRWRAFDGAVGTATTGILNSQAFPERAETATSPKLSAQLEIAPGWHAQVSLARATRFPTVGELFQGQIDSVTQQLDPNSFDPNLKPEKSRDASLMLRHRFGAVRVTGSFFFDDIDDAIYSFSGINQYGNVVSSYKNVDKVRQYGTELIGEASDWPLPGLDADVNVAWIDSRIARNDSQPDSEGVRFARIPEWRINGNLRYRIRNSLRLSLGWRYASRPNSDLLGLKRGDTYSYVSEFKFVDARLSWNLMPSTELSLGVDNIGNDRGWVSHPLPQRTYVAELKWKL
ncbi:MAG: TonB-dependent receptor [Steroidobacterales bacterium]